MRKVLEVAVVVVEWFDDSYDVFSVCKSFWTFAIDGLSINKKCSKRKERETRGVDLIEHATRIGVNLPLLRPCLCGHLDIYALFSLHLP